MVRLFIGVSLPDPVRARLAGLCEGISTARWVSAPQLHVTLRFLGWVAEDEQARLEAALSRVVAPTATLTVSGVGVFPPSRKPARVLWAGLTPAAPLVALKAAIDEVLGPDPEAGDRPYHPHVTLARFKQRPGPALAPFLERYAGLTSAPWPVTAFHLYQSRMQRAGSVYTILRSFPLREG